MANHSSATVREHTPHANQPRTNTIINALKRRAQAILNDKSIDPQSRAFIRYALEINDPCLAELVRRVDAGEVIGDTVDFDEASETTYGESDDEKRNSDDDKSDSDDAKIGALTDLICRAGDEPDTKTAALLVLMATVERSTHPKALANTAKNCAYIRSAEMNLYGMVDAQVELIERELFADNSHLS